MMLEESLFKKQNYYVNTISDFLIEVLIDKKQAAVINEFYNNTTKMTDESIEELKSIIAKKKQKQDYRIKKRQESRAFKKQIE